MENTIDIPNVREDTNRKTKERTFKRKHGERTPKNAGEKRIWQR